MDRSYFVESIALTQEYLRYNFVQRKQTFLSGTLDLHKAFGNVENFIIDVTQNPFANIPTPNSVPSKTLQQNFAVYQVVVCL